MSSLLGPHIGLFPRLDNEISGIDQVAFGLNVDVGYDHFDSIDDP